MTEKRDCHTVTQSAGGSSLLTKLLILAGWVVGVASGLVALALVLEAGAWSPDYPMSTAFLVAGILVLPPVTAWIKAKAPRLRPWWLRAMSFALIIALGAIAASALEPTGQTRVRLRNQAIVAAEADLRKSEISEAALRLDHFRGDEGVDHRVSALLAQIEYRQRTKNLEASEVMASNHPAARPGPAAEPPRQQLFRGKSLTAADTKAAAPGQPRRFDYRCTTDVSTRRDGVLVKEAPGRKVLLRVDLLNNKWCKDRCVTAQGVVGQQGQLITLAEVERAPFHASLSIMPAVGGYTEDISVDAGANNSETETDGECRVTPFTGLLR